MYFLKYEYFNFYTLEILLHVGSVQDIWKKMLMY